MAGILDGLWWCRSVVGTCHGIDRDRLIARLSLSPIIQKTDIGLCDIASNNIVEGSVSTTQATAAKLLVAGTLTNVLNWLRIVETFLFFL